MSEDTKGKVLELPEDLDEVEIRVINEEEESSESDEKFLFDEFPRDEEETFQSWDEVENLEGLERGGVWMDHPKVAGTKIMIARSDDAERESPRGWRESTGPRTRWMMMTSWTPRPISGSLACPCMAGPSRIG